MRASFLLVLGSLALRITAQGPEVTSWIINPGNETGYGSIATNVLSVHYTAADVYITSTCIPGYDIGPWAGNPNSPANQDFCFRITRAPQPNTGTPVATQLGHIGVWRNGVSIFNALDGMSYNDQGVWNRDALFWEGSSFDLCLGHPAPNGEYHHHVSPNCLYDHLDDQQHSDLIGYAFDGYPVYGAYGFANADGTGGIVRMRSSYQLRTITERSTLPDGSVLPGAQQGPAIDAQYPLGAFIEDHEYVAGSGELDEHNGRFSVTPEYPAGIYAYYVTLDDQLDPAYPYVIGPTYYGTVAPGNTGPGSGHNTVPGGAALYSPGGTGINETRATTASAHPVPSHSTVRLHADAVVQHVDLLDAQGRLVLQSTPQRDQVILDLTELPAGTYCALLRCADGHVLRVRVARA